MKHEPIKKSFPDVLRKNSGVVKDACKAAKIARSTYYLWRVQDKDFADRCDQAMKEMIELAESELSKNIRNGCEKSVVFFLSRRSKAQLAIKDQTISASI